MSLASIENINIIGFGRMGKSMLSGWLNNQLDKEVVKIVDPFLNKEDPFLINHALKLHDMDKIRLDDGIVLIADTDSEFTVKSIAQSSPFPSEH